MVSLKRFDDARAAFLAAIDDGNYRHLQFVVDDEVPVWKAHSELGATYAAEGDDVKALEWFDKGLINRPSVQALRLNRARALERLGRPEEAEEALRAVWTDFGNDQTALHYVNFLLRHGKEKKAVDVVERGYTRIPKRSAVNLLVAASAVVQKNGWPEPERYLKIAADLLPGAAEALNPLEAHYREKGDSAALDALLAAERAIEPATPEDYLRRSYSGISTGAFAEGLDVALRGLEIAPHDPMLRYNAAICHVNQGRREEALVHLEAIDRRNETVFAKAAFLRAVVLRDLARNDAALAAAEEALTADPEQIDTIVLRANLLETLGRPDEAETALVDAPTAGESRVAVELAGLYLRLGRVDDARRIAERALG